jgi:hypothetical protein
MVKAGRQRFCAIAGVIPIRVSVAANVNLERCIASIVLVFTRLSENAPDLEFRQRFAWSPFAVKVAMDFAADEAVGRYWIENVTPCICRDRASEDRAATNGGGRKQ